MTPGMSVPCGALGEDRDVTDTRRHAVLPAETDVRRRLYETMRLEVQTALMPELTTSYARLSADLICLTLDYLLLELDGDPEATAARAALVARLPQPCGAEGFLPDIRDPGGLSGRVAAGLRAAPDAADDEVIAAVGRIGRHGIDREDRQVEESRAALLAAAELADVDATADRFDRYFASTASFAGWRTQSVKRMIGGYSRDTFLLDVARPDGDMTGLAIRRDLPLGPMPGSAIDELPFLQALMARGLKVARPLAIETDGRFLGQPFLVSERLSGEPADVVMAGDPARAAAGIEQMAVLLARQHAIPPRDIGLPIWSSDPREQIRANIAFWRERWERFRMVDSDVAEAAFIWLNRNIPANPGPSVVVHGDYRPGNALMDGETITGVVDWESIHAGDAAYDIEYMKLFIAPFYDVDKFVATYVGAGGQATNSDSAGFNAVFRSLRNIVCCDTAWHAYVHGYSPSIRLVFQGVRARRMMIQWVGDALAKVAA